MAHVNIDKNIHIIAQRLALSFECTIPDVYKLAVVILELIQSHKECGHSIQIHDQGNILIKEIVPKI